MYDLYTSTENAGEVKPIHVYSKHWRCLPYTIEQKTLRGLTWTLEEKTLDMFNEYTSR